MLTHGSTAMTAPTQNTWQNTLSVSPEQIVQVVPRLSPDMDGVGEYSLKLAQQLRQVHGISTTFVVVYPSGKTQPNVDGFKVCGLSDRSFDAFVAAVPAEISTVVLQYSNYPYLQGKLDVPMWIADGLKALQDRGVAVIVMFHELPTLRYGVLRFPNLIQESLSKALVQLADGAITNNEAFQQTLLKWREGDVLCQPNFATIGEPEGIVKPLSERDRTLIVFGSTDRRRVYQNSLPILKEICERLKINTLYDIGRPLEWDAASLGPAVKTVKTGILPEQDISALLSQSFAGVFDYHRFPRNLGKSSVYAAYIAHGLLPICNGRSLRPQDDILPDRHYVDTFTVHACSQHSSPDSWFQTIATNAHTLYQTRSVEHCAQQYAALIKGIISSGTPLSADSTATERLQARDALELLVNEES